jgi:hypothetical protein
MGLTKLIGWVLRDDKSEDKWLAQAIFAYFLGRLGCNHTATPLSLNVLINLLGANSGRMNDTLAIEFDAMVNKVFRK